MSWKFWWPWSIGVMIGVILAWLIFIGIWVAQIIRLSKRKDKTLMWVVLILGFAITPFLAGLIGLFLGREREREREREIIKRFLIILSARKAGLINSEQIRE